MVQFSYKACNALSPTSYPEYECLFFSQGLMLEIIGPTLPDLRNQINVNFEEMSRALVGKAAGFFIGSVAGGILHEVRFRSGNIWTCTTKK